MALLSLRDIGKIYVSEGSVAIGLRGVNLDFDIGEFVAVTGKSGSGKTTLLNMISGMDTYEEGELYVEGQPTSHYEQSDWENYRKKYISFIFQDYNIIDSFTVLQNVELALSYIDSPRERRERALELIDRVGLTRFKKHKGSKLSGGQKQRTVIARALAKNSPIILADEPTGNLDAKSSEEIISLLAEISKDKLVIVVTHSASELEKYATREIRIFDGAVERDEILRDTERASAPVNVCEDDNGHPIRRGFELGWHRFRAMPKLSAFMSILMILAMLGTFFRTMNILPTQLSLESGIFVSRDGRLIITKQDESNITPDELDALASKVDAQTAVRYDYLYDTKLGLHGSYKKDGETRRISETLYAYVDDGKNSPDVGSKPQTDDEVMLVLPVSWKQVYGDFKKHESDETVELCGITYKICGIDFFYDNSKRAKAVFTSEGFRKCTDYGFLTSYKFGSVSADNERIKYTGIVVDESLSSDEFYITAHDESTLKALISAIEKNSDSRATFTWKKYNTTSESYEYTPKSMTFMPEKSKTAQKKQNNFEPTKVADIAYVNTETGNNICISPDLAQEIIKNLRDPNYCQASLMFSSDAKASKAAEKLGGEGYYSVLSTGTYSDMVGNIVSTVTGIFSVVGWLISILFLAFFIYLCSVRAVVAKRGDIAILRSMGIENKIIKISTYAYIGFAIIPSLVVLAAVAMFVYLTPHVNPSFPFMHAWQYVMIILGMVLINLFISRKFNKRMFKESVRKTLRGGAGE